MSRALAQLLLKDRVISQPLFDEAEAALKMGRSAIRTLIEKGQLSDTKLLYYLSKKFGLPSINLDKFEIGADIVKLVSTELVRKMQAIPIQANRGTIVMAICDPTYLSEIESLKFQLKSNIECVLTSYAAFDRALSKHYGGASNVGEAFEEFKKEKKEDPDLAVELVQVHNVDSSQKSDDAPVVTVVNSILTESLRQGASDIHVEPYEGRFRVRMRVDGTLKEVMKVPMEMKRAVLARLKIMSRMDIAESRVPQDGRIKLKASGREIDFRVNSLPTLFGEKIVLRLLDKGNLQLDLQKLGFEEDQLQLFKKGIYSANGMVLVTGPTGSGKTTTLYSALSELNQVTDNLSTVEDPVEYNIEGINQVQTHKEIGLTFAAVLRALLRQDPDVVLVGEIRDYETAEVAVQAALTGHLVLSTLHTNDAPSTIVRLMNMGLEPFLVTASVNTIVAQRLVRRLCAKCREVLSYPQDKLLSFGFKEDRLPNLTLYAPKGCKFCNNTGYKGRLAIYEVLEFTTGLKELVLSGATAPEIKRAAVKAGMQSLRASALNKAADGITSIEEAITNTMEG